MHLLNISTKFLVFLLKVLMKLKFRRFQIEFVEFFNSCDLKKAGLFIDTNLFFRYSESQ